MTRPLTVAVVGATGMVGAEFLRLLATDLLPVGRLVALASGRSTGRQLPFRGGLVRVEQAMPDAFAGVDLVFTTATAAVSLALAPAAVAAGAVVIDDGSAYRMDPAVPLVVPEVNAADVDWHRGILSTPNCTTVPLVMALAPLHAVNPVRRVVVSTYQAVSGTGAAAVAELEQQSRAAALGETIPAATVYQRQIAFNALPQVDSFLDDGYTKEERKMRDETRKILHAPELAISATCVRIPVYVGHSEAVSVECERPVSAGEFRELLRRQPGIRLIDDPSRELYPTPLDAVGDDAVLVGRLRDDQSRPGGVTFWLTCDNLRKGAALNAIQIAQTLLERDQLGSRAPVATASH